MYTGSIRSHALAAYTVSVLIYLTLMCFGTTVFRDYTTNTTINTVTVALRNVPDYRGSGEEKDMGFIIFDLKADLRPLFNWNVKQLFLYLTAEYETASNKLNQVVIWDKIIQRGEYALLDHTDIRSKYFFWDDGHGLKGNKNVTLTLSYQVIPNAGNLPNIVADGSHRFSFPNKYIESKIG